MVVEVTEQAVNGPCDVLLSTKAYSLTGTKMYPLFPAKIRTKSVKP